MDLEQEVVARLDDTVRIRRAIHRQPELSFAEHRTTELIRERMRALGVDEIPCATATGAAFVLHGARQGSTVLLRADIDALPIREESTSPFRSEVDGIMHACGHDAHTAMLLGLASVFAAHPEDLAGTMVFVFQPAEERVSGALAMIEGGLLDLTDPDYVVGCHVSSRLPTGLIALRGGICLSDGQGLLFSIRGQGGHASNNSIRGNPVVAAAELIRGLHSVVDGLSFEGVACACSAGVVQAGTASNVVPIEARIEGTLRTFTPDQKTVALQRLGELCRRVRDECEVGVEMELTQHAPPVVNDFQVTARIATALRAALGTDAVIDGPPLPPSDDVSEFLRLVPGSFFFVGAALADGTSGLHHSPTFAIDEDSLRVGTLALATATLALTTP